MKSIFLILIINISFSAILNQELNDFLCKLKTNVFKIHNSLVDQVLTLLILVLDISLFLKKTLDCF